MPTPLPWPDCRNARDLGGLPAGNGSFIKAGALIRSDSLDRLTPEGVAMVRAAGVTRILDLRGVQEAKEAEHPFSADASLYRLVPLIDPRREPERNKSAERGLADIYKSSIVRNAKSIVEGLITIAEAPDGAVLVHCAVGKDRTGMTVALALALVGVSDELIGDDYAFSMVGLRADYDLIMEGIADEAQRRHVAERMSCRAETILATLAHTRSVFGSVSDYLLQHGMTAAQLDRLRERLLETE